MATMESGRSPEFATMVECASLLVDSIARDVDNIGTELYSKHFISESERESLQLIGPGSEPSKKATHIIDSVRNTVKLNARRFCEFVEILRNRGEFMADCVRQVTECYKKLNVVGHDSKPAFKCLCGTCTLKDFFLSGCPKAVKKHSLVGPQFPFLNTPKLSKTDRNLLERKLLSEFKNIQDSFANFGVSISISKFNYPVREIKVYLLFMKAFTLEERAELKSAETISDILLVLSAHVSFFNYDLLEQIITKFAPADEPLLREYLSKFKTFCERNVFEVPPSVYYRDCKSDSEEYFALKYACDGSISLNKVKTVCLLIADILQIDSCNLRLATIEDGCVLLKFFIPKEIAIDIFPITTEQEARLNAADLQRDLGDAYRSNVEKVNEQEQAMFTEEKYSTGEKEVKIDEFEMQPMVNPNSDLDLFEKLLVSENSGPERDRKLYDLYKSAVAERDIMIERLSLHNKNCEEKFQQQTEENNAQVGLLQLATNIYKNDFEEKRAARVSAHGQIDELQQKFEWEKQMLQQQIQEQRKQLDAYNREGGGGGSSGGTSQTSCQKCPLYQQRVQKLEGKNKWLVQKLSHSEMKLVDLDDLRAHEKDLEQRIIGLEKENAQLKQGRAFRDMNSSLHGFRGQERPVQSVGGGIENIMSTIPIYRMPKGKNPKERPLWQDDEVHHAYPGRVSHHAPSLAEFNQQLGPNMTHDSPATSHSQQEASNRGKPKERPLSQDDEVHHAYPGRVSPPTAPSAGRSAMLPSVPSVGFSPNVRVKKIALLSPQSDLLLPPQTASHSQPAPQPASNSKKPKERPLWQDDEVHHAYPGRVSHRTPSLAEFNQHLGPNITHDSHNHLRALTRSNNQPSPSTWRESSISSHSPPPGKTAPPIPPRAPNKSYCNAQSIPKDRDIDSPCYEEKNSAPNFSPGSFFEDNLPCVFPLEFQDSSYAKSHDQQLRESQKRNVPKHMPSDLIPKKQVNDCTTDIVPEQRVVAQLQTNSTHISSYSHQAQVWLESPAAMHSKPVPKQRQISIKDPKHSLPSYIASQQSDLSQSYPRIKPPSPTIAIPSKQKLDKAQSFDQSEAYDSYPKAMPRLKLRARSDASILEHSMVIGYKPTDSAPPLEREPRMSVLESGLPEEIFELNNQTDSRKQPANEHAPFNPDLKCFVCEKMLRVGEMQKCAAHIRECERQKEEEKRKLWDMPVSHLRVLPVTLSFIKPVKLFQVTKKGGEYVDNSLGLHVEVPEGAVPEDCHLKLEVGMCLHGPFLLPSGTIRTSPILMLHPQENIRLRKPIEVTLPHIVSEATKKILDIRVMRADYKATDHYSFSDIECSINMYKKGTKNYAIFSLTHFSFFSLRATIDCQEALTYGYCICALCPSPSPLACSPFSYFLALTFDMDPCIEEVRQLFQERNYTFFVPEVLKPFSLKGDDDCIRCNIFQVDSGWKASLMDADDKELQEIKASAVDMWNQGEEKLKHHIKHWIYPPSFRFTLISQQACSSSFLKIKFVAQGTGEQFYLNLPLQLPAQQPITSPSSIKTLDSSEKLSIEKLQTLKGLSNCQLDQQLEFEDLPLLATYFDNATNYVGKFGLNTSQITDVGDKKTAQDAMCTALNLWHKKNPSVATYRNLLQIILCLNKGFIADQVCDFLVDKKTSR